MRASLPLLACLLTASLAGCSGADEGGDEPLTPDGQAFQEGFEGAHGTVPSGWEAVGGTWGINHTDDTAHPVVMEGTGDAGAGGCLPAEEGFSCLVAPAGNYGDFTLTASFQIVKPLQAAAGAGVVVHYVDEDNYQIIRYSVREEGWHLFTVQDGDRAKVTDASLSSGTDPAVGEWVTLRVVAEGEELQVYHGETLVIEWELSDDDPQVGAVGLFLREDTTARFDAFSVEPEE